MIPAVRYSYLAELEEDKAPRYAAAHCHRCGDWNALRLRNGKFYCDWCWRWASDG